MLRKIRFSLLYLTKPRWDTGISPPELLDFIRSHPPGRALDLGCGTGTNVVALAQNGWQATGVDFVHSAIRTARRKARLSNVQAKFYTGDVTRLDYINTSFDLILDIGCFHTLSAAQRSRYLQNIQRLLSVQGTYLLYAFINDTQDLSTTGLTSSDLDRIASILTPLWRKDGSDHHQKPSAWLAYEQHKGAL